MSSNGEEPQQIFDASPYLKLKIDKDGKWFQNGAEIVHPEVYQVFCKALERSPDGGYRVRIGQEICDVEVEDAPFIVQRIIEPDTPGEPPELELNDGTTEQLVPERFWIGDENVPYTYVKSGDFHARFTRPAYYQIAKHIKEGEESDQFFFTFGDRSIRIETRGKPTE